LQRTQTGFIAAAAASDDARADAAVVLQLRERVAEADEETWIMRLARVFPLALLCVLEMTMVSPPAHALSQNEIVARLESAGYSQVRPVQSGKIQSFKAVKNGKDVSIIVDTTGHIKELQ
jgi:hypothetical protein